MNEYLGKYDGIEHVNDVHMDVAAIVREQKRKEKEELEEKLYELQCAALVEDIDDLLWKYEEYEPEVMDNILYINKPVNAKRFLTLKRDAKKCNINEIKIEV